MIRLDTGPWPLVHGWAHGALTFEVMKGYVAELDGLLRRNEPFGMLFVTHQMTRPEARGLRHHADWLKANQAACAERWIGGSMVFDSAVPRFVVATLTTLVRMPMPIAVFDRPDAAARWLAERFIERRLPVPPALGVHRGGS